MPQISSVFSSLSGETEKPLPPRFAELKRTIIGEEANQRRLIAGWERLTKRLRDAAEEIERQQQDVSNAAWGRLMLPAPLLMLLALEYSSNFLR